MEDIQRMLHQGCGCLLLLDGASCIELACSLENVDNAPLNEEITSRVLNWVPDENAWLQFMEFGGGIE
eukprot:6058663-Prorocentrum_lima.AAC.1